MSFDERLRQAVDRGHRRGQDREAQARARALSAEEIKRLHSQLRLSLSEHIETCLKALPLHFPGFQTETLFGELGWGAACSRDDLRLRAGVRSSSYSRLELAIRPLSAANVLELTGKGAINNKEVFSRTYFERLDEVDEQKFRSLIDAWVLEYAEIYASKT